MNIRRIQRARLVAAFAKPSMGRYRSSDTPDCITTRHQDTKGGIGPRRIFTGESRGSGGNLKSSDNWHEEARELTKTARAWSGRFRLSWLFVRFSWPPLRVRGGRPCYPCNPWLNGLGIGNHGTEFDRG